MNLPFQQELSIVLLNYNRFSLLRTTLLSLLQTVPHAREILVVDNQSSDFSRLWLEKMGAHYPQVKPVFPDQNRGGESLNPALEKTTGRFILIAENDHQYLPGWDNYFASVLSEFPEVYQISPLGSTPERQFGEIWSEKPHQPETRNGITIHRAINTLTTVCLIRREVLEAGIRFHNLEDREMPLPADERFSREIQEQGWWAAWSASYQVINWGHHRVAQEEYRDYYEQNWKRKIELGIDGLEHLKSLQDTELPDTDKIALVEKAYALHESQQREWNRLQYLEEKIRQTEAHNQQLAQANQGLIEERQKILSSLTTKKKKKWIWF